MRRTLFFALRALASLGCVLAGLALLVSCEKKERGCEEGFKKVDGECKAEDLVLDEAHLDNPVQVLPTPPPVTPDTSGKLSPKNLCLEKQQKQSLARWGMWNAAHS